MAEDRTKSQQEGNRDPYAILWNVLGLPHQSRDDAQTHDDSAYDMDDELTMLNYEVLVHYQENDLSYADHVVKNKRRHLRHPIGDKCQYRISGMPSYGQGLLHNISVSGFSIGVHRKLTLGRAFTLLIETGNSRQLPLILHATVVREAGVTNDGLYRYGCQIDRVSNPNG